MREARLYAWHYLVNGDIGFYSRNRRWVAMARSVALRVFCGWDAETCQFCGRRYFWSNWVASNEVYELIHGNLRGTICPRCFSAEAEKLGKRIVWTPLIEREGIHGDIMDGAFIIRGAFYEVKEGK